MDNFSCQRHTIPIRISQLAVMSCKYKTFEFFKQEYRSLNSKAKL